MVITVASGKGGTGKTTVAVNLAASIADKIDNQKSSICLVDCDVEAPNAALFLDPIIQEKKAVERLLPVIDHAYCTACGVCARGCQYNALAVAGGKVLFFKELCHACGSCTLLCPQGAIQEKSEQIGMLERGNAGQLLFSQGTLEIGFSSPTPVIRALKKWTVQQPSENIYILDASPGASCPVVETARGSDFLLFVTEPTPFGLHDLKTVVALNEKAFHLPAGIVINKSGEDDALIERFAQEAKLPILTRIPLNRALAEAYSEGKLLIETQPRLRTVFTSAYQNILQLVEASQVKA